MYLYLFVENKIKDYSASYKLFSPSDFRSSEDGVQLVGSFTHQIRKLERNKSKSNQYSTKNMLQNYGYKPYSLQEYYQKELNKPVKLSTSLGSNVGSETWEEKNKSRLKMLNYAKMVVGLEKKK